MTLVIGLRKQIRNINNLIEKYETAMKTATPAEMRSLRSHVKSLKGFREKLRLRLIESNGSDIKSI